MEFNDILLNEGNGLVDNPILLLRKYIQQTMLSKKQFQNRINDFSEVPLSVMCLQSYIMIGIFSNIHSHQNNFYLKDAKP